MNHMNEYPRIVRAYPREQFQFKIVFKDGLTGLMDLKELVPLIDEVDGTVYWRDVSDFSTVRAYELAQQERC